MDASPPRQSSPGYKVTNGVTGIRRADSTRASDTWTARFKLFKWNTNTIRLTDEFWYGPKVGAEEAAKWHQGATKRFKPELSGLADGLGCERTANDKCQGVREDLGV